MVTYLSRLTPKVLYLVLLATSLALLVFMVSTARDIPRVLLRVVVGVLATTGYCEVMLYSAGYTTRLGTPIVLKLRLGLPSLGRICEALAMTILALAVFNILSKVVAGGYPVVIAMSAALTYIVRGVVKDFFSSKGSIGVKLMVIALVATLAALFIANSDIGYFETLLKLVEEVARGTI